MTQDAQSGLRNPKLFIAITGVGSISPLGHTGKQVWQSYRQMESLIKPREFDGTTVPVASLAEDSEDILKAICLEEPIGGHLDRTVLMAAHCARQAVAQAGWKLSDNAERTGVNIGSSRGATGILERQHASYLQDPSRRISPLTSPTTTLGNISSFVAHDIGTEGPEISHSVTCSTALHAIMNGIAWIRGGLSDRFIVGAAEAPLTGFTVAQMKALRIYSRDSGSDYPCRPLSSKSPQQNTFVLGEGAALFTLEPVPEAPAGNESQRILGIVESFGYGIEQASNATDITEDGTALKKSMAMALEGLPAGSSVEAVIMHAPGTIKGDRSELNAVRSVFGEHLPILLSNKWLIGHTFGASAALSLEYGLMILANDDYMEFPYPVSISNKRRSIRKVMINAAGFGGNAASIIISNLRKYPA